MIQQLAKIQPEEQPQVDQLSDLDDPFIGVLGQGSRSDDLWLGKAIPRYTSYPPATSFLDDIQPDEYREALAALAPEEPVSLYLHVPFCRALCLYCGCNTCPTHNHQRITQYLDHVHRELENVMRLSARPRRIGRVHFGGGSPNIMSEKDMGLMMGSLARRFDMSGCQEVAMELDPRLITRAQVRTLAMLGVTRVSLGVQDFDPNVQHAIGRVQSYEMVKEACELLRQNGIREISFDLIYGLPLQSPVSMAKTAQEVVALWPSRISLFSYAHVPQAKKHQKALEQYIMPGPHACLAIERAARDVFVDAGYVEIGMDHFARREDSLTQAAAQGQLHRNFQGYTADPAQHLIGIGASSIGKIAGNYYQNARATEDYEAKIKEYGFATAGGLRLTGEDKLRASIIEELMCQMSVNLEKVCREHHFSMTILSDAIEALAPYEEAGLIAVEGYKITLLSPHRMAIRAIASVFDTTKRQADAPVSKVV